MNGRAAVTVPGAKAMEVREYPVPEAGAEEILVKITMAGIRGSDLHMWRGEVPWFQPAPGLQGHEMTGTIAKLGSNRKADSLGRPLSEGDRVAYAYFIPCGECWACMSGTTGCPNAIELGTQSRQTTRRTSWVHTRSTTW